MMLIKTRSDTTDEQDPISIILGGIVYDASIQNVFYFTIDDLPYHSTMHSCLYN